LTDYSLDHRRLSLPASPAREVIPASLATFCRNRSSERRQDMAGVDLPSQRAYRSIFLEDGWIHQKYFGWTVAQNRPGLRLLRKSRGIVTRSLILLSREGERSLASAVADSCEPFWRGSSVVIHDFDGVLSDAPMVAGRAFRLARDNERLLNLATYAIDLEVDEDTLWRRLSPPCRRKVRLAASRGMKFVVDGDFEKTMERFYEFFERLAFKHKLQSPDPAILRETHRNGDVILTSCEDSDGRILVVNIVYTANRLAYGMLGASAPNAGGGAGNFAEWECILLLKRLGYSWYDLGGVREEMPMNGVQTFKKAFGGSLRRWGKQFVHESAGFVIAKNCLSVLRKGRARVPQRPRTSQPDRSVNAG
jgi:Acetyltransferase (GNAT) domain